MPKETNKARWELEKAAGDAVRAISNAAEQAVKTIASAAGEARNVIADNASNAAKLIITKNADGTSDHDSITTLISSVKNIDDKFTEKFADLKNDIRVLSDGTSQRISNLENEKLNIKDSYSYVFKDGVDKIQSDHEKRIRRLEWSGAIGVGFLYAIQFYLTFIKK